MPLVQRARVRAGGIVLEHLLSLPEGTVVEVSIEPVVELGQPPGVREADFALQPVFGMWADREDMRDGAAWVSKERAKWRPQVSQPD